MKISLKTRIFLLVSILVLTSMLALSCFLLDGLGERLHEEFKARGTIIVNYFAQNTVVGIIIEDEYGLIQTAETLFEIEDIVYANIYDAEGTRIVSKTSLPVDPDVFSEIASWAGVRAFNIKCPTPPKVGQKGFPLQNSPETQAI